MNEELPGDSQGKIVVFGAKQIRRTFKDGEWFFSVVDIVGALTDSENPRNYWNMMKAREQKESDVQLSTLCVQLKLTSLDGKTYKTDCVNTEGAFRIIQSIPSPRRSRSSDGWRRLVVSKQNYLVEKPKPALPPKSESGEEE